MCHVAFETLGWNISQPNHGYGYNSITFLYVLSCLGVLAPTVKLKLKLKLVIHPRFIQKQELTLHICEVYYLC